MLSTSLMDEFEVFRSPPPLLPAVPRWRNYPEALGALPGLGPEIARRAVAMRDGPAAGLALIDAILARGDLADYPLAHSARAELCRRLGKTGDARASYERALDLTRQEPQRRFLERRLAQLPD